MAEVIGVFAELAHQKEAKFIFQNCGADSEDQESGIVGTHNHLC
jgi:hypothetical protein